VKGIFFVVQVSGDSLAEIEVLLVCEEEVDFGVVPAQRGVVEAIFIYFC